MKILVTGGCGFIGSWVVRQALRAEHSVVNLDVLTYAANPDNLSDIADSKDYEFIHGDICDGELVTALLNRTRPDAIIHLAAETHVDKSIDSASDFIKTNVLGTQVLLDAATEYRNSWLANAMTISASYMYPQTKCMGTLMLRIQHLAKPHPMPRVLLMRRVRLLRII